MKFSNTIKTVVKIYEKCVKNSVWFGTGYIGNLVTHSFSLFDRNKTRPLTSNTSEQRLAYH